MIDTGTASRLTGTRGPVGYATYTNMPGAAAVYLYPKEPIVSPQIETFVKSIERCQTTDLSEDHLSFFDFRRSMMLPITKTPINVGAIIMNNNNIAISTMKIKASKDKDSTRR